MGRAIAGKHVKIQGYYYPGVPKIHIDKVVSEIPQTPAGK